MARNKIICTYTPPTEHQEQAAVISWWALACTGYGLPEFCLYAVPNAAKRSYKLAARLKAEGMRAGIPDLILDVPRGKFHGLRIEMKVKPNKVRAEQNAILEYFFRAKYASDVCWSATEAIELIKAYLQET